MDNMIKVKRRVEFYFIKEDHELKSFMREVLDKRMELLLSCLEERRLTGINDKNNGICVFIIEVP
jgi:hypothetical protein